MKTTWTPRMQRRLRELHAEGVTFKAIAAQLNQEFDTHLTKNACVGRAHRLQLALRVAQLPPTKRSITMLQLTRTTCRWPSEGTKPPYTYCGKPTWGDRPFCLDHCRVAYQVPEKRWS